MAETARSGEEIHQRVARLRPELARLGVRSLALFGSAARGELRPGSDLDLLVEFDGPARFDPLERVTKPVASPGEPGPATA